MVRNADCARTSYIRYKRFSVDVHKKYENQYQERSQRKAAIHMTRPFLFIFGILLVVVGLAFILIGSYFALFVFSYMNAPPYEYSTTVWQFLAVLLIPLFGIVIIGGSIYCFIKSFEKKII